MSDAELTMDTDHLTDRQRRYVQHIAQGMDSRAAARAAGYSESFSRVSAHRLKHLPEVAQAIAAVRTEGRKLAAYGLAEAMAEAEAVCLFAKKHRNAMAYCKATELRAKLSGLLVDKVEVVNADLRGALERAERRVIDVTNGIGVPIATRAMSWLPQLAGDPVADDHEPTPADSQAEYLGAK